MNISLEKVTFRIFSILSFILEKNWSLGKDKKGEIFARGKCGALLIYFSIANLYRKNLKFPFCVYIP